MSEELKKLLPQLSDPLKQNSKKEIQVDPLVKKKLGM
jgi:hypothetical protein